ncbi:BTB/POZ domain-containing protein POB1-like isoform X2 [Zingiber officinale]|uniref:BTB/POZ domain-containing protein POB1-like isoform X2 n=1 Tax=Zingiber officinale TaxID=94328 RepID=UPI001C4B67BA|nr:BTB/POZ domain-containing protein POB1-like isoform X2 [Zingiber officinale]
MFSQTFHFSFPSVALKSLDLSALSPLPPPSSSPSPSPPPLSNLPEEGSSISSWDRRRGVSGAEAWRRMRESRGFADILDHRAAETATSKGSMDAEPSHPSSDHNFEFAFNSSNFSDRVLRIEVMAEPPDAGSSHRKRRRDDGPKEKEFAKYSLEFVTSYQPDTHECEEYENHDEDDEPIFEEFTQGDDSENNDSSSMGSPRILRVKSIYISSAILAAKSPFFYKLFSNGMKESDLRHATLRINESEEAALMELLSFMYSGKLSTTSPTLLLDVLMAADKFEVVSCMRYCSQLLRSLPMTTESALLYLDLPCSVSMASAVQPLTDAAKDFLANSYKDINKFQDEMMSLPLSGIEAILSSDDLQVASEDAIYDFVLKWARAQYTVLEERRETLSSRLLHHIRFSHMTCRKLRKVLTCNDLDHDLASKLVTEALFFKAEAPHRQRALTADELTHKRFMERAYKYRPLKVVEFDKPHPQCIVYLDLKREECAKLFPSGRVYSQAFHLGGQGFFLSAHCNLDQQSSFHCFGLFLGMQEKGSISFTVEYEFAARTNPSGEFVSKYKGFYTFTGGKAVGYRNLFGIQWSSFIAEDGPYFINGTLHLRAELTIKPSQPPLP